MRLEILEKTENPVLKRTEVRFKVGHPGAPTPSRKEVLAELSKVMGVPEDLIALERISGIHGSTDSRGVARVYSSKEDLLRTEQEYLLKRGVSKEKVEAPQEPEKPKEEKAEGGKEGA